MLGQLVRAKQKAEAITLLPFAVVVMLFFIYPLGHDLIIALKTEYASSVFLTLPYIANDTRFRNAQHMFL